MPICGNHYVATNNKEDHPCGRDKSGMGVGTTTTTATATTIWASLTLFGAYLGLIGELIWELIGAYGAYG